LEGITKSSAVRLLIVFMEYAKIFNGSFCVSRFKFNYIIVIFGIRVSSKYIAIVPSGASKWIIMIGKLR